MKLVFVIPGLTRDPWMPDVKTPDPGSSPGQALIWGRNDRLTVRCIGAAFN